MRSNSGFTLIEVMITVAIVAILGAIAVPSYNEYVQRARITEATSALSDMRNKMEQYFQDNRTWTPGGGSHSALHRRDGRAPADFPELHVHLRPS